MWFPIILISSCSLSSMAFDSETVQFSIGYFQYRNIKNICLISCKKDIYWILKFSKLAFRSSIKISTVLTHEFEDISHVQQCLTSDVNSIGIILDRNCGETGDIMYFASENLFYSSHHKWLIIENYNSINGSKIDMPHYNESSNVMSVLDNLNISVDADIVVGLQDHKLHIENAKILVIDTIGGLIALRQSLTGNLLDIVLKKKRDSVEPRSADGSPDDEPGYFSLYDVYNIGKLQGGNIIINAIGHYNKEKGLRLIVNLNEYKYYRRWDFRNWSMRMILVISPPPKQFDSKRISNLEAIPGEAVITQAGAAILCIVAEVHNFNYKYTFAERWIGTFERNKIKVVADSLYFRMQDISPVIRHIISTQSKLDLLVTPVTYIETRYFYRIPTTGLGKFENQFLTPLNPKAWWGVIGISLLCVLVLVLAARLEGRSSWAQYAVFSVIASICQQFYEDTDDSVNVRNSTARKITILVTGLSCVLLFNYYTSSVVSWLLNGPPSSINSLRELLESPLELIFEDMGYTRTWLQIPNFYFNKRNAQIEDEMRKMKVFNKKKNAPLLVPLEEGMKMVQRGGYAYHTETNTANTLISKTFDQTELCELGSLQSIEKTNLVPSLPKNSPYKEFMTWSIMRLTERGFVSCIHARTASQEAKCEGILPRALALGGAAPVFILLAGGYLLAFIIMLFERYIYKMEHRVRIPV